MELLDAMAQGGHEQVIAVQDDATGLRGWIALHHTRRGPTYGGIRVWDYRNGGEAALDALRLSQTMTYKCVLAGVQGGGAKTVIVSNWLRDRRGAVRELGRRIEALRGVYRAGPDVGFDHNDLRILAETTRYVAHHHKGVLRPAEEATAEGAEAGIRAAMARLDCNDLDGARVAIQGLGAVGMALARRMVRAGAEVIGADPRAAACEHASNLGVRLVDVAEILSVEADVLAPCALGGVLHNISIPRLRCRVVAGVANNVLASSYLSPLLSERGILFLPDFVINAGALIEGAGHEATGRSDWSAEIQGIGGTVTRLLESCDRHGLTMVEAAHEYAGAILDAEENAREREETEAALSR